MLRDVTFCLLTLVFIIPTPEATCISMELAFEEAFLEMNSLCWTSACSGVRFVLDYQCIIVTTVTCLLNPDDLKTGFAIRDDGR